MLSIRRLALVLFAFAPAALGQPPLALSPAPTESAVYTRHDPAAINHFRTDPAVVRAMVDRLVVAVTEQPDIASAWRSLVSRDDRIGIKISAAGGELFTTHRDVVNAIVDGLLAAGILRGSIIVWDRSLEGVQRAGYQPGREGYQLRQIEPRDGYDPKAEITAPLMGKLFWGDIGYIPRRGENPIAGDAENTSNTSHFAKIVSTEVTRIINVPVMSQSETTGLAGCLYNMTLPNIDNWRRFTQYGSMGAAGIGEMYRSSFVAKKVVLNIMDGLIAAYAGGPRSHPNFAVHHATLLASRDPVALDAVALKRIEQWRAQAALPPLGDLAAHVQTAAEMGIGNARPERIQVKEVER